MEFGGSDGEHEEVGVADDHSFNCNQNKHMNIIDFPSIQYPFRHLSTFTLNSSCSGITVLESDFAPNPFRFSPVHRLYQGRTRNRLIANFSPSSQ